MPLHDWTRADVGHFHHFHQSWVIEIARALNAGLLPADLVAHVEPRTGRVEPNGSAAESGDVGQAPTKSRSGGRSSRLAASQAVKANRIAIRRGVGQLAAVIEIVTPGNKDSRRSLSFFIKKTLSLMERSIHVLVIDPFPATALDRGGIHSAIWRQWHVSSPAAANPTGRTIVSYHCHDDVRAFVETIELGDPMPDMPLFLGRDEQTPVPLQMTYQTAWEAYPEPLRAMVAP